MDHNDSVFNAVDEIFSQDDDEPAIYLIEEHTQATEAQEPQSVVNTSIHSAREDLLNKVIQDQVTDWMNEDAWKDQPTYKDYEKTVKQLLHQEKSDLNVSLDRIPSRQGPRNLLQHVLEKADIFYPPNARLHKAKFLLCLITDLDPTQLSPKRGWKPLHAAAAFDIKMREESKTSNPDLTIYTCDLMKDKAAAEIGECNQNKENILHLAIRHDLKGLERLIEKANSAAFKEQRISRNDGPGVQPDDGNTPLHDALNFQHFLMPGPSCSVSRKLSVQPRTRFATEQEGPRSTVALKADAAQQQANRVKVRARTFHVCTICSNSRRKNSAAWQKRRNLLKLLLQKYPEAQTIHNSAGFSPYLHLLTASQQYERSQTQAKDPLSVARREQPLVPVLAGQTISDSVETSGVVGSDSEKGVEKETSKALLEKKLRKEKELQLQQEELSGGYKEDLDEDTPHSRDTRKRSVREAGKQPQKHTEQGLEQTDIGSGSALALLKETAFHLGGYKKACDCLFPSHSVSNSQLDGGIVRQRIFSLEGPQRVQDDTIQNFDFLHFEPMMASVVLSLEYTQEELQDMPNNDQERLQIWRQDEANLKAVFDWIKDDKKVVSILSLTVKDNPNHYCSDDTVVQCLRNIEVRYLNWNRPNLCVNDLALPETVIELSLYWTGFNSVLWSWSSAEGLKAMKKLRIVHLYIQRGADDAKEQDRKVDNFKERVAKWNKLLIKDYTDERHLGDSGKGGGLGTSLRIPKHPWIETAGKFGDELASMYRKKVSEDKSRYHVKVALLDDGVDPTYDHNGTNLHHDGWPSIDHRAPERGVQSFYVSTNQHGSKMAWLIRRVCPFVTIYVAKLDVIGSADLRRRSFSLQQATEAIKWATAQNVDIISMSWNARLVTGQTSNAREIEQLENALHSAAEAKILLFGAACDVKGSSVSERWVPCSTEKVWSIGAADMDYDTKKYVQSGKIDYLFPGEHVLDSHRKEDVEVGNSGATALAAGLAAIVIFCMKIESKDIPHNRYQWMGSIMNKVFNSEENNKSVRVKDVLQLDKDHPLLLLVQQFEYLGKV